MRIKKVASMLVICLLVCVGLTGIVFAKQNPSKVAKINEVYEMDEAYITEPDFVPGYTVSDQAIIIANGIPIISCVLTNNDTGQEYLVVADHDLSKVAGKSTITLAELGVTSTHEDPVWKKNFPGQLIVPAIYKGRQGVATIIPVKSTRGPSPRCFDIPVSVNKITIIF